MKKFLIFSLFLTVFPAHAKDRQIIISEARKYGISEQVILHVARRESTFRCSPKNPRYHGPLQISFTSAKALGYRGPKHKLNDCGAGLTYGLKHLSLCVKKVGQNPSKAAKCHASPARFGVFIR